jgi:hypothetical protein
MSSGTVRTRVSGNWAYLWGFWRFWGTGLSAAYRPVPARLQYGCSKFSTHLSVLVLSSELHHGAGMKLGSRRIRV